MITEYLVIWKGYGPEFDCWMNIKDLQDASELVRDYEKAITSQIDLAPALKKASLQSELPRWG